MTKIFVRPVAAPSFFPVAAESMNAREIGKNLFELRNSSCARLDTTYGDVVSAVQDEEGNYWLRKIIKKSKYSSIRVACIDGDMELLSAVLTTLNEWGVGVSGLLEYRVALITIPPDISYQSVLDEIKNTLKNGFVIRQMSRRHLR